MPACDTSINTLTKHSTHDLKHCNRRGMWPALKCNVSERLSAAIAHGPVLRDPGTAAASHTSYSTQQHLSHYSHVQPWRTHRYPHPPTPHTISPPPPNTRATPQTVHTPTVSIYYTNDLSFPLDHRSNTPLRHSAPGPPATRARADGPSNFPSAAHAILFPGCSVTHCRSRARASSPLPSARHAAALRYSAAAWVG